MLCINMLTIVAYAVLLASVSGGFYLVLLKGVVRSVTGAQNLPNSRGTVF